MKKLKVFLAFAIVNIALVSCSSNDDNSNNPQVTCDDAIAATAAAAQAYSTATAENFVARCNAYRDALETQIAECGDDSGALQALIDGLGDCTAETSNGAITVNVGSSARTFDNITVTTVGSNRHVVASEDQTSYSIEFDVAQNATGMDIISNFKINLVSPNFIPLPDSEGGNWTSNITVNNATSLNGTFSGIVRNGDNAALELTAGVIDLDL